MKTIIIGGGSIGTRHLQNFLTLGVQDVTVVEPSTERADFLRGKFPVTVLTSLDEANGAAADCAVIASPTALHLEQAMRLAEAGSHLFIEKPLALDSAGTDTLAKIVADKGLITLVGCNMRFHPGPRLVKQLIEDHTIGKVLFARIQVGFYLPKWRPQIDYRTSYSAHAKLGGGCILDCIHELDLARWYFGSPVGVFCRSGRLSRLEIDVEDYASFVVDHLGGVVSEVHLDYLQQSYERDCQVVGEHGTIKWNFSEGIAKVFIADEGTWTEHKQEDDWQVNDMYMDETRHFLDCVSKGVQTTQSVAEAAKLMKFVDACFTSSTSKTYQSVSS